MKNLIMSAAILVASISTSYAQTYQNDYQKIITEDKDAFVNYTLCETKDGGYAMVSFLEARGSYDQNRIQIFKTDANFKVIHSQRFIFSPTTQYAFEIKAFDIFETTAGFIISGGIINEGDTQYSGGFLLSIKNDSDKKFYLEWMQIYPNNDTPDVMAVADLRRVVEVKDGYIAIGPGRDNANIRCGLVLKTDLNGNIKWSKHFYGTEYERNNGSVLNDIVRINDGEVAIVGSVNGFPKDDADVNVIRLRSDGEVVSNSVYEFSEEAEDPKYTYLERGAAIEYNKEKNELIIAGTVTKKIKGRCVTAEYKDILTFGVDLKSGEAKWATRHDIGADKTFQNESFFCSDIDFGNKDYAISGTVQNRLNTKLTHYNGFILRLNEEAKSTGVRFYGAENQDFLSRIYYKSNSYVAAGMFNESGKNMNWMIESYNNIKSDCYSKRAEPVTKLHPMRATKGADRTVYVKQNTTEIKATETFYNEDDLCKKLLAKATLQESVNPVKRQ
jgi:hypothetical protein